MADSENKNMSPISKKLSKLVKKHIEDNAEYGWIECVTSLSMCLTSLIHAAELSNELRDTITEKVILNIKSFKDV